MPCKWWSIHPTAFVVCTPMSLLKSRNTCASSIQEGPPEETFEFAAEKPKHFFKTFQPFRNNQPSCVFLASHILISFTWCRTREVFLCPAEEFFQFFLIFVDIFGSHVVVWPSSCSYLTRLRKKRLEKADPFRVLYFVFLGFIHLYSRLIY